MNQINSYTKNNITEHDLEIVQLNNPEKNEKRISEINKISTELNENQLENEEYLEKVLNFGSNMKENIIYDIYHFPQKFISEKQIKKAKEGSILFAQGALSSLLNNNDITCAIEKENENVNVSLTTLQLISGGEAFRKVI